MMKENLHDKFYVLLITEKQAQDPNIRGDFEYREDWMLRPCIKIGNTFLDIYNYENYIENRDKKFFIHDIFTYTDFLQDPYFSPNQKLRAFWNKSQKSNIKFLVARFPTLNELEPYLERAKKIYQEKPQQSKQKQKIYLIK